MPEDLDDLDMRRCKMRRGHHHRRCRFDDYDNEFKDKMEFMEPDMFTTYESPNKRLERGLTIFAVMASVFAVAHTPSSTSRDHGASSCVTWRFLG